MLKSMVRPLVPEFEFAGIQFPKYVWSIPRGPLQKRLAAARNPCTGGYFHAPKPDNREGIGFYLGQDGNPFRMRWQWCDDAYTSIEHTGWFCDEFQDEKIRGVVIRLPRGRGFLAGWSMGEGMASHVDYDIHETARDAALRADSMAEQAADDEREYQATESARIEAEENEKTEQTVLEAVSAE